MKNIIKKITKCTAILTMLVMIIQALPQMPAFAISEKTELLNLDFNNTSFPQSQAESRAFNDFYCEYPSYESYTVNFENVDFINSKKYYDVNNGSAGAGYYMSYGYKHFGKTEDKNGGAALSFHKYDGNSKAWGENQRTTGLIIPFTDGGTITEGRVTVEFDAGKMNSVGAQNQDVFTFGFHDANNEITVFDKENAWSNSTAFMELGDYYETATLVYKPRGISGGYSYYFSNLGNAPVYGENCLWPENCATIQGNNNIVRHYKIDLDLDSGIYDIYQNNIQIAENLKLPEKENLPAYDAFVVGAGWSSIDYVNMETSYLYLDNVKVTNILNTDKDRTCAAVWLNRESWSASGGITAEFEEGSGSFEITEYGCKLGAERGTEEAILGSNGGNIGFNINSSVSFPESSSWKFHGAKKWVTFNADICYYDIGYGGFFFQYDSYSGVKNIFVQCQNTKTYKYARFKLYDARFDGQASGYDCRIVTHDKELMPYADYNASPEPVYIYWLKIYSDNHFSSYNINAAGENAGNVFYEGDEIKFNISYTPFDSNTYTNLTATYSVYLPERGDEYLEWEETIDTANTGSEKPAYSVQKPLRQITKKVTMNGINGYDEVTFDELPFGIYVLKTDITADYGTKPKKMRMSKLTDFSYSKKALPNSHFGINTHYDDYVFNNGQMEYLYDENDIDNQISLAKNAGFGMIRTGLRWSDIQKQKNGEYVMPDIIKYGFRALRDNGIIGLCNFIQSNANGYGSNWDGEDCLGNTNDEIEEFGKFVSFAAGELGEYTKHYSILNEFDLTSAKGESGDQYDAPTYNEYAALLKEAYTSVKNIIPDAWIDAGNIADDPSWQFNGYPGKYTWDTKFYNRNVSDYFDSVSYHRYDSLMIYGPEGRDLTGFTKYGKSQVDKYAPGKKMWVTEIGWPARNRQDVPRYYSHRRIGAYRNTTFEKQAEFYPRSLAMYADRSAVDMFMFYEFQDDREDPFSFEENFGIVHSSFYRTPWAAKPAYVSTAAFNSIAGNVIKSEIMEKNPEYGSSYTSLNPVVYKLTNDMGREIYCLWKTEGSSGNDTYMVDTGCDYALVYDLYGNIIDNIHGGVANVELTTGIKYVVGADYPVNSMKAVSGDREIKSIADITDGDYISLLYTQAAPENPDVTIICASYMGNKLKKVYSVQNYVYKDGGLSVKVSPDNIGEIDKIKFFAFEADGSLTPKMPCLEIK